MPTTRLLSNLLSRGSLVVAAALTAGCLGTPAMPDTDSDTGTGTDTTDDVDDGAMDASTTGDASDTAAADDDGSTTDPASTDEPPVSRFDLADCPKSAAIELLVPGRAELVANHEVNLVWRSNGPIARVQAWLSADMGHSFPHLIADIDATGAALQVAPWDSTRTKVELAALAGSVSPLGYKLALAAFDHKGTLIGCSVGERDFELRGWPDDDVERLGDLSFPDPALAAAINTQHADPTLRANLVHELSLNDAGIADLLGLAHLPMLNHLRVEGQVVTSVAELSWMTNLQRLSLDGDPLTSDELALLSGLTNLEHLTLDATGIAVSALPELPKLGVLSLAELELRNHDLALLPSYPQLTELRLAQNLITDLSTLPLYEGLQALWLGDNAVSDVAGLPAYAKLANLQLDGNALTHLDGLPELPSLVYLQLADNDISDLAGLVAAPGLTNLNLNNNALADLSSLPPLPKLQQLVATNNALDSLEGAPTLPELAELTLSENSLTSAEGLPSLAKLRVLRLSDNQLTTLDGMPELPALETLQLSGNALTDVSALTKYSTLKQLTLSGNAIDTGVLALAELENLTYLSLADNPTIPCILQNTVKAELLAKHPEATVHLSKTCIDA